MPVKAEIITIGDEILYGQTLDTNSHWISGKLDLINIKVFQKTTIGDTKEHILSSLADAESRADIIFITGGLGPTNDDLTKPCLAEYFGADLILNEEALEEIKTLFNRAGRTMTIMNEKQAELPANCTKITNTMGTAPGMWFEERGKIFISMPGVPYEMKAMMEKTILPSLKSRFLKEVIFHKIVRTVGVPESRLAEAIKDWENQLPNNQKLAYLPTMGQVKLRITGTGSDQSKVEDEVMESVKTLIPLIEQHIYGYDSDELAEVLGKTLKASGATLATAESCTGGQVAAAITAIPGSSSYFKGSIIAYDNEVKKSQLQVNARDIDEYGAVSEQVVKQMAENVRDVLGTDIGLATSGVAGPTGGTPEKPVGTIWMAYADDNQTVAKKWNFTKDRNLNIQFATIFALNLLRLNFKG